jgi:NAD(P)-dependent dehydrogenase (short-subunit alcohol dehydrogenase family)
VLDVLRPGALGGTVVCVAGEAGDVAARCAALGADVRRLGADLADEDAVAAAVAELGRIDVLVAGADGPFPANVDGAWNAVRAVANACWVPEDEPGGKAVLIAPSTGGHAGAAAAALENTARTLSVEWARFGVRVTALRPGEHTGAAEVAELVAFLASEAGDYYSGCAFTLG